MNAHTKMLHVRIDTELKEQASQALAAMGLTTADAVRLLFHRIIADQAFPLELKVPNAQTRAAMAEVEELRAKGRARFDSADAIFSSLEQESANLGADKHPAR